MASRGSPGHQHRRHPFDDDEDDDTDEKVYCHDCSNEWYRSRYGLECPRCGCEFTEIISSDSDPRAFRHHSSASTSPEPPPFRYADDSDPDEADIEEHTGPHGFVLHRHVRPDPNDPNPHTTDANMVLNNFWNLVQERGGPAQGEPSHGGLGHRHAPRIRHHTTITTNHVGGGSASFTIFSSTNGPPPGRSPDAAEGDPFQSIFSNVLRDMHSPHDDHDTRGGPVGFAQVLQQLLGILGPGNANFGDAVYSQEALDRIITDLMETNPQSNAAPPASQGALDKLERREITKDLLGADGKVDCSICIDELKEGETATFLPCKHWFHNDCVTLWLKEHNTCPICRTPIESSEPSPANANSSGDDADPGPSEPVGLGQVDGSDSRGTGIFAPVESRAPVSPAGLSPFRSRHTPPSYHRSFDGGITNPGAHGDFERSFPERGFAAHNSSYIRPRLHNSRPPSHSQSGINEVMRSISRQQELRQLRPGSNYDPVHEAVYDTSGFQRRTSHSPPRPSQLDSEAYGSRMRQRSPSHSSRQSESSRDSRRQSHGPISWLRDRFSSSGGSNRGNPRDDRYQ